ncbi:MAG: hypothetical protein QOE00_2784 [Ilumatobacteraceae bacterium]|jgi:non-heme chloroperoxidase
MHRWPGSGGVIIAGDSWGDSSGPLVVLQHGGGQTRHAWRGTGQMLAAAGYHVVAFDARGHGDSSWAANGVYSQDSMVDDLVAVLAALGNRRPVLVGASMGGGTNLVAVGEGRVDATALVLVDIAPQINTEGATKIAEFMALKPDGFDNLEEVAEAIASYQPHRERPRTLDGLAKNVRLGEDGKFHWHWDPKFMIGPRDLHQRQARLEACAANLKIPTLLVRGGLSDVLTEEGAQSFLAISPQSEYVNVHGAAHMVAGDRNDIFAGAVIEFLSRVVPTDNASQTMRPPRPHHRGPADDVMDVP